MKVKRIIGLVVLVVGFGFILMSNYIKHEVNQGKEQVSSAQGKVDTANSLFSATPATKKAGKQLTSPVQKKIDEGKGDIAKYSAIARWLQIGGIVFIAGGAVVVFMTFRKCGKCK